MSKHSMRNRIQVVSPSSPAPRPARACARCCEPSSASSRASAMLGALDLGHVQPDARVARAAGCTAHASRRPAADSASISAASTAWLSHQQRRHRLSEVVLGDEGFQHLRTSTLRGFVRIGGRRVPHSPSSSTVRVDQWPHRPRGPGSRPVAQVAAAAHHGQVDAGPPALHAHGQDVDVAIVADRLLFHRSAGAARATAPRCWSRHRQPARTPAPRRMLLSSCACSCRPAPARASAEQEALGVLRHVARVVRGRTPARRRARSSAGSGRAGTAATGWRRPLSSQVRSRNTFWISRIVSFTAQAPG